MRWSVLIRLGISVSDMHINNAVNLMGLKTMDGDITAFLTLSLVHIAMDR